MSMWSAIGAVAGGVIGSVVPGLGTAMGATVGGALGGTVDTFSSNSSQVSSAQAANEMNINEAQKNRDWQEYMYKNRHQMEVEDLKAAGLNPMLSVNSASGVPSGSTASVTNPRIGETERKISMISALAQAAHNISSAKKLEADAKLQNAKLPKANVFSNIWKKVMPAYSKVSSSAKSASSNVGKWLNTSRMRSSGWTSVGARFVQGLLSRNSSY